MPCAVQRDRGLLGPWFLLVMILATLDLGITIAGIVAGIGFEANPLFAFFTQRGVGFMLVGAVIYYGSLIAIFSFTREWLQSIVVGLLVTVHIYGFLSWVRLAFVPQVDVLFGPFALIVGPPLVASVISIVSYVKLRTCPAPLGTSAPATVRWVNE